MIKSQEEKESKRESDEKNLQNNPKKNVDVIMVIGHAVDVKALVPFHEWEKCVLVSLHKSK